MAFFLTLFSTTSDKAPWLFRWIAKIIYSAKNISVYILNVSITANIDTLKADLKEKKASLKAIDKEIVKLEAKKAKADAKAAEEAKKTEAESVLKKLLAEGMSADEILAKLK